MKYSTNPKELYFALNHFAHDVYEIYHKAIFDNEELDSDDKQFIEEAKETIELLKGNNLLIFNNDDLIEEFEEIENLLDEDSIPEENVGYEILTYEKSSKQSDVTVVLGHNKKIDEYVTWEYRKQTGFYWGHYFGDIQSAYADLKERV